VREKSSERAKVNKTLPAKQVSWEAEGVRFSAFPPPSVVFELRPLWEQLVGRPPDEVQERPQQGVRNEFGSFNAGHLFITQQLSRIDFIFGVHPNVAAANADLPSVGNLDKAADAHREVVTTWLSVAPSLGRIAYAPTAINKVKSIEDAYALLRQLLPRLPIDEGVRNMFWQINRPRRSKILRELTINRVSKWSALSMQIMQIQSESGKVLSNVESSSHCSKVELDIYTEPFTPIPAESLSPLFEELVSTAYEILADGDVP
jgi:hypothetical protein